MRVVHLRAMDDPRFVDRDLYRAMGDHERLRAQGVFVAEGRLVVARLVERQRGLVRSLLLNPAAHEALRAEAAALGDDVTAFICETSDFEMLTGYPIHRGCLALASRPVTRAVDEVIAT